jgi:hypothetical protein
MQPGAHLLDSLRLQEIREQAQGLLVSTDSNTEIVQRFFAGGLAGGA